MAVFADAMLIERTEGSEGRRISLYEGMTVIGRAAQCEIVVDDPGISRHHAGIRNDANGFWIADLGSRNGTLVNNEPAPENPPRRLRHLDQIQLVGQDTSSEWLFMESQATMDFPSPNRTGAN
jgi:pSer/pThr/pTyr-binding forkhead associated (FHA) protein